tara:strand:+ start:42 stop:962 length:921 start_codon:yes stop_codon:yes gene_type:complete
MTDNIKKSKRGRKPKPKNQALDLQNIKKEINSEEEPLIAHLNISLNEIMNDNSDSSVVEEDSIITNSENDSVFIKSENEINKSFDENIELTDIEKLENEIMKLKFQLFRLTKSNKIEISRTNFDKNTKCWWCKNKFECPSVGIPELYFENKFYCTGNFCSYNCALAYNINNGDNVWKRTSLLNLLYHKTYSKSSMIKAAPDWKNLKEFGGSMSIEEFRKNSIINTNDYTLLHPPMETRVNTFEKHFKSNYNNKANNSVYQKLLDDSDELVLKRSKPLKSSQYSLDKTLFIKKKERIKKMNKLISII